MKILRKLISDIQSPKYVDKILKIFVQNVKNGIQYWKKGDIVNLFYWGKKRIKSHFLCIKTKKE